MKVIQNIFSYTILIVTIILFDFAIGNAEGISTSTIICNSADGTCWMSRNDFPFTSQRHPISISIGSKGYVGIDDQGFYEYQPTEDSWSKISNLPEGFTYQAPSFELNNKLYLIIETSVWVYDPFYNKWIQKSDIPSNDMRAAFAFSAGGYGFVGGGFYNEEGFWQYDPRLDQWRQLSDLPDDLAECTSGSSFVIGNKAYITGTNTNFWQYDIKTKQWTQKAYIHNAYGKAFNVGERGYLYSDGSIYQYDDKNDDWDLITTCPLSVCYPALFAMDGHVFVGLGGIFNDEGCTLDVSNQIWDFVPDSICQPSGDSF